MAYDWNRSRAPASSTALSGTTTTAPTGSGGGATVTIAVSAAPNRDIAMTSYRPAASGATSRPLDETLPPVLVQVTFTAAVSPSLVRPVARNWTVPPAPTSAVAGETITRAPETVRTTSLEVPDFPSTAALIAVFPSLVARNVAVVPSVSGVATAAFATVQRKLRSSSSPPAFFACATTANSSWRNTSWESGASLTLATTSAPTSAAGRPGMGTSEGVVGSPWQARTRASRTRRARQGRIRHRLRRGPGEYATPAAFGKGAVGRPHPEPRDRPRCVEAHTCQGRRLSCDRPH